MKIILIFLYIHLTFSFYEEFIFGYDLINNFSNIYTSLYNEVNKVKNAKSSSEKTQRKEDLIDVINKIIGDLNDKEKIKKLKKLIDELNGKDHLGNILSGHMFINEGVSKVFSKKNAEAINNFQKEFCDKFSCNKIPIEKMKDSFESLIENNKVYEYLSNIGRTVGVFGQGISIYNNFQKNYSKCKYKNEDSAGKALFQTGINTITNLGFNRAGAVIGSFFPIPFVGSLLGGIAGNYIGSFVNSQMEMDC